MPDLMDDVGGYTPEQIYGRPVPRGFRLQSAERINRAKGLIDVDPNSPEVVREAVLEGLLPMMAAPLVGPAVAAYPRVAAGLAGLYTATAPKPAGTVDSADLIELRKTLADQGSSELARLTDALTAARKRQVVADDEASKARPGSQARSAESNRQTISSDIADLERRIAAERSRIQSEVGSRSDAVMQARSAAEKARDLERSKVSKPFTQWYNEDVRSELPMLPPPWALPMVAGAGGVAAKKSLSVPAAWLGRAKASYSVRNGDLLAAEAIANTHAPTGIGSYLKDAGTGAASGFTLGVTPLAADRITQTEYNPEKVAQQAYADEMLDIDPKKGSAVERARRMPERNPALAKTENPMAWLYGMGGGAIEGAMAGKLVGTAIDGMKPGFSNVRAAIAADKARTPEALARIDAIAEADAGRAVSAARRSAERDASVGYYNSPDYKAGVRSDLESTLAAERATQQHALEQQQHALEQQQRARQAQRQSGGQTDGAGSVDPGRSVDLTTTQRPVPPALTDPNQLTLPPPADHPMTIHLDGFARNIAEGIVNGNKVFLAEVAKLQRDAPHAPASADMLSRVEAHLNEISSLGARIKALELKKTPATTATTTTTGANGGTDVKIPPGMRGSKSWEPYRESAWDQYMAHADLPGAHFVGAKGKTNDPRVLTARQVHGNLMDDVGNAPTFSQSVTENAMTRLREILKANGIDPANVSKAQLEEMRKKIPAYLAGASGLAVGGDLMSFGVPSGQAASMRSQGLID